MRVPAPLACMVALATQFAVGQDRPEAMPPIDNYLLDEAFEIALAVSAAPAHISGSASVLVLRRDGYHELRQGTNGFTCLVERSWSVPLLPEQPIIDFWSPEIRAPICYNAEASGTILGEYLRRTELAMAGKSRAEMKRVIDEDFAEGNLRAPRGLAMSYMMSAGQLLGTHPSVRRFKPHVMFYVPYTKLEDMGSPSISRGDYLSIFEHAGGPYSAIVVVVPQFIEVSADEGRP